MKTFDLINWRWEFNKNNQNNSFFFQNFSFVTNCFSRFFLCVIWTFDFTSKHLWTGRRTHNNSIFTFHCFDHSLNDQTDKKWIKRFLPSNCSVTLKIYIDELGLGYLFISIFSSNLFQMWFTLYYKHFFVLFQMGFFDWSFLQIVVCSFLFLHRLSRNIVEKEIKRTNKRTFSFLKSNQRTTKRTFTFDSFRIRLFFSDDP